jgi:hypothetical protein
MSPPLCWLIVLAAFAVVCGLAARRRLVAESAAAEPLLREFFARTGYRYTAVPGDADAQLREHERRAREGQRRGGGLDVALVRVWRGVTVYHDFHSGWEARDGGERFVTSCCWSVPLARPPAVRWQAAARALDAAGRRLVGPAARRERSWQPELPVRITTGDGAFDARIVVYGEDAEAVRRVLATPGLKQALLSVAELDLCVGRERARFADPLQKNGRGGRMARLARRLGGGQGFAPSVAAHDRIADLLTRAVDASR